MKFMCQRRLRVSAAQFVFLCVGKCPSLYNRRWFVRDKRSESWTEREGEGRESILGKPRSSSLCLSLSRRTGLLRISLSTFFFFCLVPTLDQRRDVLWKGLNFATFGKFRSRCVGTSPGVCEWWRTFGRRLRIELGDAEGDVLGENFTVTSRPAIYCGLFNGKRWFKEILTH